MLNIPYPASEPTKTSLTDYTGVYQVHRIGLRTSLQLSDVPVYLNVTAKGDTLFVQQTGSEKTWLRSFDKDRFLPARSDNMWYVFNRDKVGKVISVTGEGTIWTLGPRVENKKVDVKLPDPIKPQRLDKDHLHKYVGVYYMASLDIYRFIETDGTKLYNRFQGRMQELLPTSDNRFVLKGVEDTSFEFKPDETGVLRLTIKSLRSQEFRKID